MKKIILMAIGLLLILSTVSALTSNSINEFSIKYDYESSQLTYHAICKSGTVATLTLSNNYTREVICDSSGLLNPTILIPPIEEGVPITGTLTIQEPCNVCTINNTLIEAKTDYIFPIAVLFAAIILFAVVYRWIVFKLKD